MSTTSGRVNKLLRQLICAAHWFITLRQSTKSGVKTSSHSL